MFVFWFLSTLIHLYYYIIVIFSLLFLTSFRMCLVFFRVFLINNSHRCDVGFWGRNFSFFWSLFCESLLPQRHSISPRTFFIWIDCIYYLQFCWWIHFCSYLITVRLIYLITLLKHLTPWKYVFQFFGVWI